MMRGHDQADSRGTGGEVLQGGAGLQGGGLGGLSLRRVNLSGAKLQGAEIIGTDFRDRLPGTPPDEARTWVGGLSSARRRLEMRPRTLMLGAVLMVIGWSLILVLPGSGPCLYS